jgi:hypothetical protein
MNYRKLSLSILIGFHSFGLNMLSASEVGVQATTKNADIKLLDHNGGVSPANPGDNFDSEYGSVIRSTYLGRYFRHEQIRLRQILGLDQSYSGYEVESVVAVVHSSNGELINLLVNDHIVQSQRAHTGDVYFGLYGRNVLDEEVQSLQLGVQEQVYIESVRVTLRVPDYNDPGYPNPPNEPGRPPGRPPQPGRPGYPGNPGHPPGGGYYDEVRVPISLSQQMYDQDHINLRNYINLSAYEGYQLVGIQLYATPLRSHSLLNIYVDGARATRTLDISRFNNYYEAYFNYSPIVNYNTEIELYNSEALALENISLILRR